jgi:outer membrane biosynthesis protein TonB
MHKMRIGQRGRGAVTSRRAMVTWTKIACGAALSVALLGSSLVQPVAAQDEDDDTIVLTAGGSTLTVSPGNASAVSAVAEAHASPGHAETIAAAARAVADCEDGALAEGAAALAVAHPDEGAATETWLTATEAKNNKDNDEPIRKVVEKKCHVDEKEEKKAPPKKEEAPEPEEVAEPEPVLVELPDTGIGMAGAAGLSSLFAAASAAAALGSVALRGRRETGLIALRTTARED